MKKTSMDRRKFLKSAAGAALGIVSFPYIIRAAALGKDGAVSPSNKIAMGFIGTGGMGTANLYNFIANDIVRVIAVCDVDSENAQKAKKIVDDKYGNTDCKIYKDFRDMIGTGLLNAVCVATPDNWHAIAAVESAKAGLDIYGEKPITHKLREGRILCDTVKRYGRIWQTGSWQRSVENFRQACELVRNGRIGKVHKVEVYLPSGNTRNIEQSKQPPANLDWDFWLGPAPVAPYREGIHPFNWRWVLAYGGGQLMDWIGHHLDIAHWALDLDKTGPVEIETTGKFPKDGLYDNPLEYEAQCKYADGLEIILKSNPYLGTKWYGENNKWIYVDRGRTDASDKNILKEKIGPNETRLYYSNNHWDNFIECVKTRKETITPCETAHRSASVGHLAMASLLTGKKIKWDPKTERILENSEAEAFLSRSYRSPWSL
jgi:predicted dehydrogenase